MERETHGLIMPTGWTWEQGRARNSRREMERGGPTGQIEHGGAVSHPGPHRRPRAERGGAGRGERGAGRVKRVPKKKNIASLFWGGELHPRDSRMGPARRYAASIHREKGP